MKIIFFDRLTKSSWCTKYWSSIANVYQIPHWVKGITSAAERDEEVQP